MTPAGLRLLRKALDHLGVGHTTEHALLKFCAAVSGDEAEAVRLVNTFIHEGRDLLEAKVVRCLLLSPMACAGWDNGLRRSLEWVRSVVIPAAEPTLRCVLQTAIDRAESDPSQVELWPSELFGDPDDDDETGESDADEDFDEEEKLCEEEAGAAPELRDLHELGLDASATWDDIHSAYRRLAKKFHPDALVSKDLHPDLVWFAEERFKQIGAAYERLRQRFGNTS